MCLEPSLRSSVFLARVWLEDGLFRARVTEIGDLSDRREETVIVTGSADEVEWRLRGWLAGFIAFAE